jgi:hypothetical protein
MSLQLLLWHAVLGSIAFSVQIPAIQIHSHYMGRFVGRLAIRAAKLAPKADRTIWSMGGIYKIGILTVEAKNEGTLREQ